MHAWAGDVPHLEVYAVLQDVHCELVPKQVLLQRGLPLALLHLPDLGHLLLARPILLQHAEATG